MNSRQTAFKNCQILYKELYNYGSTVAISSAEKFVSPDAEIYNCLPVPTTYRTPDSKAINLTYLYGESDPNQVASYRYDEFSPDRGKEHPVPLTLTNKDPCASCGTLYRTAK